MTKATQLKRRRDWLAYRLTMFGADQADAVQAVAVLDDVVVLDAEESIVCAGEECERLMRLRATSILCQAREERTWIQTLGRRRAAEMTPTVSAVSETVH